MQTPRNSFIHRHAASLAVLPVLLVALVFYFGSTVWSVVMSLTASKIFPDMTFVGLRQYLRLFKDDLWLLSMQNLLIFAAGHARQPRPGLHPGRPPRRKDNRARGSSGPIYLYPLAISLIITGLVWQWLVQSLHGPAAVLPRSRDWTIFNFNWVADKRKVMYALILAAVWQSAGFYMVLSSSGIKGIDNEIWQAGRIDGISKLRMYIEVIIPMMKFTFLTAFVLLSIGAVKAYDIIVAMTNGGPGGHSVLPSYYIVNMYIVRQNIAVGASGSTILLLLVVACMLPVGSSISC